MNTSIAKRIFIFSFIVLSLSLFAYDPVSGSEEKLTLQSPSTAGGRASVTGGPFGDTVPGSLAVNPALGGAEQRPILDISYLLLAGLKKEEKGFGHTANLAVLYPARWGTIAGSLHFLNSEFNSLKLGTMGGLRFSYSKDLTEKFLIGIGSYADFGKDWGLGLDIGVLYKFGNLGFLKDSKLGVSITGIGKTFNPKTTGIKGKKSSGSPAMFTPHAGFASTFVDIDGFKLGMHLDISAPLFQNFVMNTGVHTEIADIISFRTGFVINAVEAHYKKQTFIPSFNLGVKIKINSAKDKNSFMAKQGWEESELRPEFTAKPFYNGIWAFGGGVNMHFGLKDDKPPVIEAGIPEGGTVYFSPNDDGENDAMEIPLKITDKRYVTAWSCEIKDENGNTVRTIANKIPLREMKDAKTFFKLLGSSKKGVDVPETLRWDGRTDSGETAPDGKYTFVIRAEDDNKNTAETEKYIAVIDKTPPQVTLAKHENSSDLIFSPDGDGNKDVFVFENTGSKEDLWTAVITDSAGKPVRTIKTENSELKPVSWDGKNDEGKIVPDGRYKYTVGAVDKAKNKTEKTLSNIIVDTNKPSINISINKKAFSPKSDSNKTIEFTPSIPFTNGLTEWIIEVKNESGNTVKTFLGNSKKIEKITFDGKDNSEQILPEGKYKAFISAKYINGYNPKTETPTFTLDITPPDAEVSVSEKIFSPDGDGKLDSVIFTQSQKAEGKWTAEIYKTTNGNKITGSPVYKAEFGNILPNKFEWTGRKSDGSFAEDGKYAYILRGTDEAENAASSKPVIVELNTEKADIILQSNYLAFSPNGDGSKDVIEFYPVVKSLTGVSRYKVTIKNSEGKQVKTFEGAAPPKKITWDGKPDNETESKTVFSPDGKYSAEFEVELANKNTAKSVIPEIIIDTVYPEIQISAPYLTFSPVAGNKKKTLPITQISSQEKLWTAEFIDLKNKAVKTYKWENKTENIEWAADDNLGNKVQDGKYSYAVKAEDEAGNKTIQRLDGITVDSREAKGYITAKYPVFSPSGNGKNSVQEFSLLTNIDAEIANWNMQISNIDNGNVFAEWNTKKDGKLPKQFRWDGKNLETGKLSEDGTYMAIVYIEYKKGDIVTAFTEPFILSSKPAKLGVTLKPKYFSPDNDGIDDDLFIALSAETPAGIADWKFEITEPEENGGRLFWKTGGTEKITNEIIWDGRSLKGETVQSATDYPFTFTVTDKAGIVSVYRGYIPVDILVIRDGNKLKIAVPSIIFRANAADFDGLDAAVVGKNNAILKRVAEILNKFPEYQVQVEGHANTTTGTEKEEVTALIPLSTLRAEAVRKFLIANGVRSSRLSSIGMGGSKPVVPLSDKDNWWKNRRVEFILIK
ncbi:FlgD immunoglobulin-like domain containing protein [Treponema pedis]|uniref:FlgD immunoglobulin-like domain containing protein n=1 Tax=Treponema pedis TaxID=409322 RepID=UPI00197DA925|nr:FlgD immunoglobulin-like domain containing protein [Treponema pedis]QSI03834.1 cell envelope biogenesis protein OmpA [Treponema pedis]